MLGAPLVQVHIILFSEKVFEVGEFKFGLLMSTYGIGAVMIAPWLAAFGTRFKKSSLLVGSLALYGCGELLLTSTKYITSACLAFCRRLRSSDYGYHDQYDITVVRPRASSRKSNGHVPYGLYDRGTVRVYYPGPIS